MPASMRLAETQLEERAHLIVEQQDLHDLVTEIVLLQLRSHPDTQIKAKNILAKSKQFQDEFSQLLKKAPNPKVQRRMEALDLILRKPLVEADKLFIKDKTVPQYQSAVNSLTKKFPKASVGVRLVLQKEMHTRALQRLGTEEAERKCDSQSQTSNEQEAPLPCCGIVRGYFPHFFLSDS